MKLARFIKHGEIPDSDEKAFIWTANSIAFKYQDGTIITFQAPDPCDSIAFRSVEDFWKLADRLGEAVNAPNIPRPETWWKKLIRAVTPSPGTRGEG